MQYENREILFFLICGLKIWLLLRRGRWINKKKRTSAKFEVTPANRRLGSAAMRLFRESPQLSSYITGQTKACYSFLELKGEVLALVLGMDRWSLKDVVAPSGDLLLVNILCPVRSKMLQSEWDHCWLFILLEVMAPDDYFITLSCFFFLFLFPSRVFSFFWYLRMSENL